MTYRKVKIYFSSGTGNSYRLAEWFSKECIKRNIDTEIIPVNKAKPREEIEASGTDLVALAYPTHCLMPTWSVIKFIFRMPVKKGTHVFCMPTSGRFHIGSIPVPGAAGLATILPLLILPLKGYNVRGAMSFDMPVSILNIHPSLTKKRITHIIGTARKKSEKTFDKLFSGKLLWLTWNNLYDLLWGLLPLIFFPAILVAYLLFGRLLQAKIMFANTRCTGCGTCAKACPAKAIIMKGRRHPMPYWGYKCDNCLRCMAFCKHEAVEAGQSWALILIYIILLTGIEPFSKYLFFHIDLFLPDVYLLKNVYFIKLVKYLCYYFGIILAYYLFHYLIRFKIINKLFTYTTFTHYYRRYNEPETTLNELAGK